MPQPDDSADDSYFDSVEDRPSRPPGRRLWAGITGLACAGVALLIELFYLSQMHLDAAASGTGKSAQDYGPVMFGFAAAVLALVLAPVLLALVLALIFGSLGAFLGRGAGRWLGIATTALATLLIIPPVWVWFAFVCG